MAKGRGSKSTKLQAARGQPKESKATSPSAEETPKPDIKGKSKQVNDELRQAVKDLGGDDDDLDLIAGIDSDEEQDTSASSSKGKKAADGDVDEVSFIACVCVRLKRNTYDPTGAQESLGRFHEGAGLQVCGSGRQRSTD